MIIDRTAHIARRIVPTDLAPLQLHARSHAARWQTLLPCVALVAVGGCETARSGPTPSADQQPPHAAANAAPGAREDAAQAPSGVPSAQASDASTSEWREFVRRDDVPVCVFNDWLDWQKTEFIDQTKPNVSLRANHAINFGVFAPDCVSPSCVHDAALQCWTELEGSTIKLFSKYSGSTKPGVSCAKDCESAAAHCFTPLLPKGTYEVVYGSEHWKLRVPSVVREPCLKR